MQVQTLRFCSCIMLASVWADMYQIPCKTIVTMKYSSVSPASNRWSLFHARIFETQCRRGFNGYLTFRWQFPRLSQAQQRPSFTLQYPSHRPNRDKFYLLKVRLMETGPAEDLRSLKSIPRFPSCMHGPVASITQPIPHPRTARVVTFLTYRLQKTVSETAYWLARINNL
jgi:hypothetical protein